MRTVDQPRASVCDFDARSGLGGGRTLAEANAWKTSCRRAGLRRALPRRLVKVVRGGSG